MHIFFPSDCINQEKKEDFATGEKLNKAAQDLLKPFPGRISGS